MLKNVTKTNFQATLFSSVVLSQQKLVLTDFDCYNLLIWQYQYRNLGWMDLDGVTKLYLTRTLPMSG